MRYHIPFDVNDEKEIAKASRECRSGLHSIESEIMNNKSVLIKNNINRRYIDVSNDVLLVIKHIKKIYNCKENIKFDEPGMKTTVHDVGAEKQEELLTISNDDDFKTAVDNSNLPLYQKVAVLKQREKHKCN